MGVSVGWGREWWKWGGTSVQAGRREVDLAHFGTLFPSGAQTLAEAGLALVTMVAVVLLAWRRRDDLRSAGAVVVAGGVLAAPHALATDLVLVAVALALWGRAAWYDWLLLSAGAPVAALAPAPTPAVVGVVVIGGGCARAAGLTWWRREPAPLSAG